LYGYIYNYVKGGAAILRLEQTAFESERLNFGTNKIKRLHRLRLTGAGSVHLCIFSGDAVWAYSLKLERGFAETRIRGRGKDFYFSIAPGKNAYVDGLEVTYTVEE